jgi:Ser/Thr protein kinase RdoA (MazF antagonist)
VTAPAAVVARYPAVVRGAAVTPFGAAGGFSGAAVWRLDAGDAGTYALKAWPPTVTPGRLHFVHSCQSFAATLTFVPRLLRPERSAESWVAHAGRLWDVSHWRPGRADFHANPTPQRLTAACQALARLHAVWADTPGGPVGPVPAVARRLRAAAEWRDLVAAGWRPDLADAADPVTPWAARAWHRLPALAAGVPAKLAPWAAWSAGLHPCLCDVWHDHVLFEGDRVSGVIDYGAVKVDHAAADLARLLGSLGPGDDALRDLGLRAYREVRPLAAEADDLARALDETGAVLGAANWLRWLYHERRAYADRAAVARRLGVLVLRLEAMR